MTVAIQHIECKILFAAYSFTEHIERVEVSVMLTSSQLRFCANHILHLMLNNFNSQWDILSNIGEHMKDN